MSGVFSAMKEKVGKKTTIVVETLLIWEDLFAVCNLQNWKTYKNFIWIFSPTELYFLFWNKFLSHFKVFCTSLISNFGIILWRITTWTSLHICFWNFICVNFCASHTDCFSFKYVYIFYLNWKFIQKYLEKYLNIFFKIPY